MKKIRLTKVTESGSTGYWVQWLDGDIWRNAQGTYKLEENEARLVFKYFNLDNYLKKETEVIEEREI